MLRSDYLLPVIMKSYPSPLLPLAVAVFALSAPASRAVVLFDGISDVAAFNAAASGTFMGTAVSLDSTSFSAALNSVSSFEVGVANVTGAAINARPVRLNMWLYMTYNPSATTDPVFADQIGTAGAPSFTFNFASVSLNNNTLGFATLTPAAPVVLTPTSGTTIGIVLNWQIDQGAGFVNLTGLTTVFHINTPPSVGANAAGTAPNFGFYQNVGGETNGNFQGTSIRSSGADSGLLIRINGPNVPEPAATAMVAVLGGTMLSRRRRS